MSVGTIGASSGAAETLPAGAKAKVASVACAGYKKLGTLAAGNYIISAETDVAIFSGSKKLAEVKAGNASSFKLASSASNLTVESRGLRWNQVLPVAEADGVTWNSPMGNVLSSYVSDDGTKGVVNIGNARSYITTNSGVTYKQILPGDLSMTSGNFASTGLAMTADGSYIYAPGYYGTDQAKYSTNGGASWSNFSPSQQGYGSPVSITTVGNKFVAVCTQNTSTGWVEIVYGTGTTVEGYFNYDTAYAQNYSTSNPTWIGVVGVPNSSGFSVYGYTGTSYQFHYRHYNFNSGFPANGANSARSSTYYNGWSGSNVGDAFRRTPDAVVSMEGKYNDNGQPYWRVQAALGTTSTGMTVFGFYGSTEKGSAYYSQPNTGAGQTIVLPNTIWGQGGMYIHQGYNTNQYVVSYGGLEFFQNNLAGTTRSYTSIGGKIRNSKAAIESFVENSFDSFFIAHRLADGSLYTMSDNSYTKSIPSTVSIYESAI